MEATQFLTQNFLEDVVRLLRAVLDYCLFDQQVLILFLIKGLDVDREGSEDWWGVLLLLDLSLAMDFVESLKPFDIGIHNSRRIAVHLELLDLQVHLRVFRCHLPTLVVGKEKGVCIGKVVGIVGSTVGQFGVLGVIGKEDIVLGVDEVVCASSIEALALPQDLFLALLRHVDVVVLAPLLGMQVVGVAVVVAGISTALVDEEGVEVVGRLVYVAIGLFDLLVQLAHLVTVPLHAGLQSFLVFSQDCDELGRNAWLQRGKEGRILQFILNIHLASLCLQESLSISQKLNQTGLPRTMPLDGFDRI
jgi:hypothetical protein